MLTLLTIALLSQPLTPPPLVSPDAPVAARPAPVDVVKVTHAAAPDERSSLVVAGAASIVGGFTAAFFAPAAVVGRFTSGTAVFGLLNLIPGMPVIGLLADALCLAGGSRGVLGGDRDGPLRGVLLNSLALLGQGIGVALLAAPATGPAKGVQLTGVHVGADTVGLVGRF